MRRTIFQTQAILGREDGIAMLTILMLTVILTVIGIAAITTTTLDLKSAGGERMRELSINTAEACLSSAVQIIQQTLANSAIPGSVLAGGNPTVTQKPLQSEIMGVTGSVQLGFPDVADPQVVGFTPNATLDISGFRVNIDIDHLFVRPKPGGSLAFGGGYDGTGASASVEVLYRINCFSAGGTQSLGHVTGVYACVASGESCQRRIG
jgi:hypothetical protein